MRRPVGILTLHVLKTCHYMFLWYKQTQMDQKVQWATSVGIESMGCTHAPGTAIPHVPGAPYYLDGNLNEVKKFRGFA